MAKQKLLFSVIAAALVLIAALIILTGGDKRAESMYSGATLVLKGDDLTYVG